jgi:phosphonate transport system permease protein
MTSALVPDAARFPQPYRLRHLGLAILVTLVLVVSGQRVGIDRAIAMTASAVMAPLGLGPPSPVADALARGLGQLWPLQFETRDDVARLPAFDADALPPLAYLETETRRETALDPETSQAVVRTVRTTLLVQPLGYVGHVALKMLETLEIALWGTLVAILLGLPLALLGAQNTMPVCGVRLAARGIVAVLRAIPELISALFLVMAFGFGPIPGVLALGLHAAGFLGKFYADDMEASDPAPQRALSAIGASRLAVWRVAILPQVMPQFIAYTLYIFDRNVRMATVIGLVGAGGIGQELRGRFDMYQFGHVGTILLATLLVVVIIDLAANRLRKSAGL